MIYLGHNATIRVLPEVFEAMRPFFCTDWGNPSNAYKFGSSFRVWMKVKSH
jgi:cysteine desulfurase